MGLKNIDWRRRFRQIYGKAAVLPPVLRTLVGIVLVIAGVLGIVLPVLGFWMVPLGFLFIALDVPPWRRRLEAWLERDSAELTH